jgi:hypothetical protein
VGGNLKANRSQSTLMGDSTLTMITPDQKSALKDNLPVQDIYQYFNQDEWTTKRRKERKRTLTLFRGVLADDLQAEMEALSCSSSVSSVSAISAIHDDDPSKYSPCSADCWLKVYSVPEQVVDPILSAPQRSRSPPRPRTRRSTSSLRRGTLAFSVLNLVCLRCQ